MSFPGAVPTVSDLLTAVDRFQTTLTSGIDSDDTSFTIASGAGAPATALTLTIGNEIILATISGNTVTVLSRGYAGTSAASHLSGSAVRAQVSSPYHNLLRDEIIAIAGALGPDLSEVDDRIEAAFAGSTSVYAANFDFPAQTPGGSLSAGSNTITLSPVPEGVNGSNVGHYLYISSGTGTAEAVLITGGTAVSGASSGTVIVTAANSHSGAWTISSATGGIQEAIHAGHYNILLGAAVTLRGPVTIPAGGIGTQYTVSGVSRSRSMVTVASNFPLSVTGVFRASAEPGPIFSRFTVLFTQPDSTDIGTYTHWPPAFYFPATPRFELHEISIHRAWDGISAPGNSGGAVIDGLWMSAFGAGIAYDGSLDTTRINNLHFWPFGLTANQGTVFLSNDGPVGLDIGSSDDVKISNSLFINQRAIHMKPGIGGFGGGLQVINTAFDTASNVRVEAGVIYITSSYFSTGFANRDAITVLGGVVSVLGCYFFNSSGGGGAFGSPRRSVYAPLTANAEINISNCRFQRAIADTSHPPVIEIISAVGAFAVATITGNQFYMAAPAWTNPIVYLNNTTGTGRLTFIGNRILDQLGTTKFLKVNADNVHYIWGNSFLGSISDYPASKVAGTYQDDTLTTLHGSLAVSAMPVAADNTAALGLGLVPGTLYRTVAGDVKMVL